MDLTINMVGVLLGAVASMVVGFLWYSNMLFGKAWSKLQNWTEQDEQAAKKSAPKMYGISLVLAIVTSYVLAHVIDLSKNFYDYTSIMTGLTSGFWMWLGFVMPVQLTGEMFGKKNWKVFMINTFYQLAWLLAAGVIIGWLDK